MEKDLFDENSELFGSGQFIVLASQVDSQPDPALDLPALQQGEEESCDSEVIYPVMEPSAAQSGSLVLVTDSEVEAVEKRRASASSDACVIGETASEDNVEQGRSASSSDDVANVTVIAREVSAEHQQDTLSQDLFAEKDEEKVDRPVATPSHHLATLHLSGQPMLVPETLEESLGDEEICPSPDAYSDMPHIIPSTPSLTMTGEGGETEYNPGEIQTLNSQQGRPVKKSLEQQSLTESQKRASAGASASASVVGLAGPTLAGDLPDWQQSQSLCLLMTSSSSTTSQSAYRQMGQLQSRLRTDSQGAFQSQDVKSDDMFAVSQNVRLGPVLSQNTAQPVPESYSLLVANPASESQTKTSEKGETETTKTSSSKESSADVSVSWRPVPRAAISIDMVHSESQSASETTFKLERPELGNGEKKGESEEASASQNVFQRTRQSRRIAAARQTSGLSEDSEDMFANMGKAAGPQSLSDSDPIPCSQNRPAPTRPLVKQEERMDTLGEDSETPVEEADVYNMDTVMDSDPEDEGTQSYEVFPALSRNSSVAVSAPAGETEEVQVPQLLPSIPAVSPSPPREQSREVLAPSLSDQPVCQSQPISERASQVAARLAQLSALSDQAVASGPQGSAEKRPASQPARLPKDLPAGRPRVSSQLVRGRTAGIPQQVRGQTAVQQRLDEAVKGCVGEASVDQSHPEPGGDSGVVDKDGDEVLSRGKNETLSKARREGALCQQLTRPDSDPYTFCGSQSQLMMEAEGTPTSRAETSVSTVRALKNKPKALLGRRRKLLVKKKEMNPISETKTSSTDDGTESKTVSRPATRKTRKGEKLTGLQRTVTDNFKIPRASAHGASRVKDSADVRTEVSAPSHLSVQRQSTVQISSASNDPANSSSPKDPRPAEPQASTSRASEQTAAAGGRGDSQDSQKLRKRKSVEFSSVVQMDSPPLPLSLEENFSDSQSSDTVLEVTEVTDFIMRLVKRRIVVRKIDKEGNIVQEKTSLKEGEPVLVEEINHTSKRRVAFSLSPSRSGSTLESGDLADISSSSLSNKASSGPSSLERGISSLELPPAAPLSLAIPLQVAGSSTGNTKSTSQAHSSAAWKMSGEPTVQASLSERMDVGEHSLGGRSSVGASPAVSFISPNQSAIERDDSRLEAVVTSSSSGLASETLYSADNKLTSSDVPCAQQPPQAASSSSSSSGVVPPTADESSQKQQSRLTTRSSRKATRSAPADSSQEDSQRATKVTSSLETQSFLPGSESGGFSVSMSGSRKKTAGSGTSGTSSGKAGVASASSPKRSSHVRQSSQETSQRDVTSVQVPTASDLEIGARVMCRWKDGFFYPAKFVGLNTGIGNKFKVLFEDGMEKMVRAVDLVMAQNLPLGQSVLVTGEDGVSDPGIIIKHVPSDSQGTEKGEVLYDVAMDDGSTRKCRRSQLILSEDQAACLLSDEEYRATLGETDLSLVNTADVSLDNVIQGKRLRTKGSPAVGVPRIVSKPSTSSVPSDQEEHTDGESSSTRKKAPSSSSSRSEQTHEVQETLANIKTPIQTTSTSKSSSCKRKTCSVATSTPIPKRIKTSERQRKPRKAEYSPLGGAVASPELPKRPTRKARVGLFENVKGPIPTNSGLFKGYVFLLTYVEKTPDVIEDEKRLLQTSSLETTSAEESTDEGCENPVIPFDKEHLTAQIHGGGGSVLSKLLPSSLAGASKKLFLISNTFQKTMKYFQCLAANVPAVSHEWIVHSCTQNQLLDYKSYVLPAGISLEKRAIVEKSPNVSCLAGYRVLLTSSVVGYLEVWTSVLEMARCKIMSKFATNATGNRPGVDVVVSDHTCVKTILDKARQLGVPVVSSEWVIQCLINNSLPPHDAHPRYNHEFWKYVAKNSEETD